ncbi:helix-turn-helix transcriptional regulator [Cryobacterium algoricola]|uniref:helix-turn-helix transcriptional regulator n=1 Tax=Cryobacterium algoricola TaxID=1259183 RepID=UPI00141B0A5C|nr:helix-turn-helix domain-containing protein [Cryobacterium algoricola]
MPAPDLDARTHRALSGVSRVAVLEVLRTHRMPLDIPALAAAVGLHPNTVRSHLDRLLEVGLVTEAVEARTRPGRPRLLYASIPPESDPAGPGAAPTTESAASEGSYRLLAGLLADSLAAGAPDARAGSERAGDAGRRWSEEFVPSDERAPGPIDPAGAIDRVVEILDVVGFAPAVSEDRTAIELHRCPFLDVAKENSAIVCSVHRGLMQGALDRMHAPAIGIRLEPFVRPGVCVAHVVYPPNAGRDIGFRIKSGE